MSIYQLSFTFIASQKEAEAKEFAISKYAEDVPNYIELRDNASSNYLDSIGGISIFGFTSYNDAKGKELNKGLDLRGGINQNSPGRSQTLNIRLGNPEFINTFSQYLKGRDNGFIYFSP